MSVGRSARRRCIPLEFLILLLPGLLYSPCVLSRESRSPGDSEETVRWTYDEQWRRGTDEDGLFFGMVVAARQGPDGHLYLLDGQRNKIFVLDRRGEHLRTMGREGDGPGEFRRPVALEFLADGRLGVVQRIPGKVVCLDLDGEPRGVVHASGPAADSEGGFRLLTGVRSRGGTTVFCGEENRRGQMTQFLSVVDTAGRETKRLLSRPRNRLFETRLLVERDEDFVQRGRWTVGPTGAVYTAPHRDRYLIEVRDAEGELLQTIEHPALAHTRTAEELEEIAAAVVMTVDGRRVRIDSELEPSDPCIEGLHVTDEGELWVLTSRGARDVPAGVFAIWDVFAADGSFDHRRELCVPGDPRSDRLVLLPNGEAVLLKGYVQARRANRPRLEGEAGDGGDEDVTHFVIGLRRAG